MLISVCPLGFSRILYFRLFTTVVLERRIVEQEHAIDAGWRVIKDWVEAQLALIEANQVKIEQVFLRYAITSQGITLYEQIVSDPCLLLERNQS